jgi:hypothetical protein
MPGGWQVRVRTWRHWSDASVDFDADTGDLVGYAIDRYADPPTNAEIDEETAVRAVREQIEIPPDAEFEGLEHFQATPEHRLARLEWRHLHAGLPVDGDFLRIVVHPRSGRIVEYERKWRVLRI